MSHKRLAARLQFLAIARPCQFVRPAFLETRTPQTTIPRLTSRFYSQASDADAHNATKAGEESASEAAEPAKDVQEDPVKQELETKKKDLVEATVSTAHC